MSTAKSQDHWKALALLLDVTAPEEPEEEESAGAAVTSEKTPELHSEQDVSGTAGDLPPEAAVAQDRPLPQEPSVPAEQPPRSRSGRRPSAARVEVGHWRGLAGELGIEVPFDEPEEVEQLVAAPDLDDESPPSGGEEPVQTLVSEQWAEVEVVEVDIIQPSVGTSPQPIEDAEPPWFPAGDLETEAQFDQLDADDQPPPAAPTGRVIPSLFDHLNFSIDTPGALDRIFDEQVDEDERQPIPAGFEEREAYCESDEDSDDSGDLASFDDEEDTDESEETIGASAPATTDAEERPRRRRRRRRRKKTTKEGELEATAVEAEEEVPPGEEFGETAAVDQDLDELSHDDDHPDEDDDDDLLVSGVQHRKIPTWDEAVSVVISANMDSRAKNPGSASRGRGRGRGRRS
jgi:hypothetical protein